MPPMANQGDPAGRPYIIQLETRNSMATPNNQVPVNKWLITIAVMAGTFMEIVDTTVVNVALPHIAGSMASSCR